MKETKSKSLNRKFLFPLIAFSLPFIFLLLVEGILRLSGFGESFPVFIEDRQNPEYLMMNPEIGKRYFKYYGMATKGQFDVFKKEKTDDTFRVFVQGASSVVGFPYNHSLSFPRILERQLKEQYPERNIEVVNMAIGGIASQALLDQAPEIINQQPDAILFYAGHNEYYGTDGVGSSQAIRLPLWLKNWYQRNKFDFRLLQLIRNVTIKPNRPIEGKGTMMERMVARPSIEQDSKEYKLGIRQYKNNLQRILRKYQKAGVPVWVGSLVSNLKDQEPFISAPRILSTKLDSISENELKQLLADTKNKCPECAEDFFELGHALLDNGNNSLAAEAFTLAKEADQLRFRAPDTLNSLIKQLTSGEENLFYVPVMETFQEASPAGIVGSELLLEHVHPNVEGYQLMAQTFFNSLSDVFFNQDKITEVSGDSYLRLDSIYGEMLIHRLKMNWPFVDTFETVDPYKTVVPDSLDFLNRTALLYYREEMQWIEATVSCFEYYMRRQHYQEAVTYADALIQEIPYKAEPKSMKASALMAMKNWNRALSLYQKLLPTQAKEQAIQGMAICLVHLEDWSALKQHVADHRGNQKLNPLFFQALTEIATFESAPDNEKPFPEQVNIALAYGYLGLPEKGLALLDKLDSQFPGSKEIDNARLQLKRIRR